MQTLRPLRVLHQAGLVNGSVRSRKDNLVGLDVHLGDLLLLRHGHECAVIHFLDGASRKGRHQHAV